MLSSPSQPLETTTKSETTVPDTTQPDSKESTCDEVVNDDAPEPPDNVTMSETNHVIGLMKPTEEGVTNGAFLTVSSAPIGRSSRFRPP